MKIGHCNQAHALRRTAAWPVLASLLGLLLTHGVALACLVYCVLIQPLNPLLGHRHQHCPAASAAAGRDTVAPPSPVSPPVLEQGEQAPLAVPIALGTLLAPGMVRRFATLPSIRFASWIVPLPAPPPRLSIGH